MKNVHKLEGDQLQYLLDYMLFKMADKELAMLGGVDLNADNGQINLSALQKFRDSREERYESRKEGIYVMGVGN